MEHVFSLSAFLETVPAERKDDPIWGIVMDMYPEDYNAVSEYLDERVERNETHEDSLSEYDVLLRDDYYSRKEIWREYLMARGIPERAIEECADDIASGMISGEWYRGFTLAREDDALLCVPFDEHEIEVPKSEFSLAQWVYAEHSEKECLNDNGETVLAYRATDAMACFRVDRECLDSWLAEWKDRHESV